MRRSRLASLVTSNWICMVEGGSGRFVVIFLKPFHEHLVSQFVYRIDTSIAIQKKQISHICERSFMKASQTLPILQKHRPIQPFPIVFQKATFPEKPRCIISAGERKKSKQGSSLVFLECRRRDAR